jgi:hypothetical protein
VYFRNCYALGNVSVYQSSGTVNVGGFAGNFENGVVYIEKCFAAGTVSAHSSSNAATHAGGLLGYTWNSKATVVTNSTALGSGVTVKSNRWKNVRRVIGANGEGTPGSNNYALETMRIERSNTPSTLSFPFWDGTGAAPSEPYYFIPSSASNTDNDGVNVSASTFRNQSFWQTTLGFSSTDWNFSGVANRGYPVLAWEKEVSNK